MFSWAVLIRGMYAIYLLDNRQQTILWSSIICLFRIVKSEKFIVIISLFYCKYYTWPNVVLLPTVLCAFGSC
jgi:hypothetical protein